MSKPINWRSFYTSSQYYVKEVYNAKIVGINNKATFDMPVNPNNTAYLQVSLVIVNKSCPDRYPGNSTTILIDVESDKWVYISRHGFKDMVKNLPPRYKFTVMDRDFIFRECKMKNLL